MIDREMHRALMADAQKLRDEGVDCPDPIFIDDEDLLIAEHGGTVVDLMQALKDSLKQSDPAPTEANT